MPRTIGSRGRPKLAGRDIMVAKAESFVMMGNILCKGTPIELSISQRLSSGAALSRIIALLGK
ncbi:hypothetical protein H5410_016467 [Solanum commersonii]|uniref:Uncharacterized protein n=1 Tax=Solanum commersonii TaxID=4109 RepID=A0A9J5ZX31_SOLCO|nr:hypothetical protein H5410_016467 [Solanum commersonii]